MRRPTRQELVADSRDEEQHELGTTWNTCPDEGLCAWCLARICEAEEDYETLYSP
jgi:hypothetical protein